MRIYHKEKGWDIGSGSARSIPFTVISDDDERAIKIKEGYDYEFKKGQLKIKRTKLDTDALIIRSREDFENNKDKILYLLAKRAGIIVE